MCVEWQVQLRSGLSKQLTQGKNTLNFQEVALIGAMDWAMLQASRGILSDVWASSCRACDFEVMLFHCSLW